MRKQVLSLTAITTLIFVPAQVTGCFFKLSTLVTTSERNDNFQTGFVSSHQGDQKETTPIHTFFGDPYHLYSIYNVKKSTVQNGLWSPDNNWQFYGNYNQQLKYFNNQTTIKMWRNETSYAQLIVVNKDVPLKNITYKIINKNNADFAVSAKFLGFTYSQNQTTKSSQWVTIPTNQPQRAPDSLRYDSLTILPGRRVQPLWLTFKSFATTTPGNYDFDVQIYSDNALLTTNTVTITVDSRVLVNDNSFATGGSYSPFAASAAYGEKKNMFINIDEQKTNNIIINTDAVVRGLDFLSTEHKKYIEKELLDLRSAGQTYVTGNVDQFYNADQVNYYRGGTNNGLVNWYQTDDNCSPFSSYCDQSVNSTWQFDFTNFNSYFEYAQSLGFTKIWANAFGNNFDDTQSNPSGTFPHYALKKDGSKKLFWDKLYYYSNRGRDAQIQFLKAFAENIKSHHWEGKVYIVFDELSPNGFKYYYDLFKSVDPDHQIFKFQYYAGWKWVTDWNNSAWVDALYGNVKNEYTIDELVLEGYKIQSNLFGDNLPFPTLIEKMNDLAASRRKNGLTTEMYTTQYTYPSSNILFDYGENLWGPIFSYALGLDGYEKWAFNYWLTWAGKDEKALYTNPDEFAYGPLNQEESAYGMPVGQNFMIYPAQAGSYQFVSSVRWELMKYAVQQVWKINQLKKDPITSQKITELLNNLSWPKNPSQGTPIWYDQYYKFARDFYPQKSTNIVTTREMIEFLQKIGEL
ncbi:glycoside hydrolase domain-containing protein [Spiroplasma sp. DGKH1]|uniref:glycoside hydrolase domain-containing protein n=1 Tax=Spiroplasma sp. DGKH1 TaxID=3050074 RepID=UPI0034C686C8